MWFQYVLVKQIHRQMVEGRKGKKKSYDFGQVTVYKLFNKLVTQESLQKIQMDGVHRIGKGGSQ